MKDKIVQYLPLTHLNASYRLFQNLNEKNIDVIFDLEDSAQDIFDMDKTNKIKLLAQKNLINILNKNFNQNKFFFNIRVNSFKSKFFKNDLNSLKNCNLEYLRNIYIPKIENYRDIEIFYKEFKFIENLKLTPIIETVNGLKNIRKILEDDISKFDVIKEIHFGHFDYFLDKKQWPFPDPFHYSFWDEIKPLIMNTIEFNKTYVHSPYPFIENKNIFWSINKHIKDNFPNINFKLSSINYLISTSDKPEKIKKLKLRKISTSNDYHTMYAKRIIKYFEQNRSSKRSFAVTKKRFIAPHQYIMAKKFLKNESK